MARPPLRTRASAPPTTWRQAQASALSQQKHAANMPSGTYENARTAASRAFGKLTAPTTTSVGWNPPSPTRESNQRRSGPGSHLAQRRSEGFTRAARSSRSTDLPRTARSSVATPSTESNTKLSFDEPQTPIQSNDNAAFNFATPIHRPGRAHSDGADSHVQPALSTRDSQSFEQGSSKRADGSLLMRARDQYMQEHQTRTVRQQRSIIPVFAKSLRARASKAFSTKSSKSGLSTNDTNVATSEQQPIGTRASISLRARKLSISLKRRVSRVLGRGRRQRTVVQAQQINSPHIHFGSMNMTNFANFSGSQIAVDTIEPCEEVDDEVEQEQISAQFPDENFDADAHSISTSNACTTAHGKSRVTSWNDSSEEGTIRKSASSRLGIVNDGGIRRPTIRASASYNSKSSLQAAPRLLVRRHARRDHDPAPTDIRRLFSAVQRRVQHPAFDKSEIDVDELLDEIEARKEIQGSQYSTNDSSQELKPNAPGSHASAMAGPRDLVSPSIYSLRSADERAYSGESYTIPSNEETSRQQGTAWVQQQHSVIKHDLSKYSPPNRQPPAMTSGEWRKWTKSETEEFDRRMTSLRLNDYSKSARLLSSAQMSSLDRQTTLVRQSRDCVDERYPLIAAGKTPHDRSQERNSFSSDRHDYPYVPSLTISKQSPISESSRCSRNITVASDQQYINPLVKLDDLRDALSDQNEQRNASSVSMSKPAHVRKSVDTVIASKLSPYVEDNVLQAIRRGPYASPSPAPTSSSSDKDSPIKVYKRTKDIPSENGVVVEPAHPASNYRNSKLRSGSGDWKENWTQIPSSSPPAYI